MIRRIAEIKQYCFTMSYGLYAMKFRYYYTEWPRLFLGQKPFTKTIVPTFIFIQGNLLLSLGNFKLKYIRLSSIIDILFVLNNFIGKRFTTKSKELLSDFLRQEASVPYIKLGRHLLSTSCRITSSEAILPSLPNIAFNER